MLILACNALDTIIKMCCVINTGSYYFLFVNEKMHSRFTVLAIILSIALAEKYAMVFGTADEFINYSIASVVIKILDKV